ncbi:hypothetical protein JQ553_02270 [Bradyrhizobium lablabi]|nr:hypothetical protein [Bradyrhizobium lablabi]
MSVFHQNWISVVDADESGQLRDGWHVTDNGRTLLVILRHAVGKFGMIFVM